MFHGLHKWYPHVQKCTRRTITPIHHRVKDSYNHLSSSIDAGWTILEPMKQLPQIPQCVSITPIMPSITHFLERPFLVSDCLRYPDGSCWGLCGRWGHRHFEICSPLSRSPYHSRPLLQSKYLHIRIDTSLAKPDGYWHTCGNMYTNSNAYLSNLWIDTNQ